MKKGFLYLAVLFVASTCYSAIPLNRRTINLRKGVVPPPQSVPTNPLYITIWLHGSRSTKILNEYLHAAPSQLGLHPITDLNDHHCLKRMIRALSATDPQKYPFEHCYSFGWFGDISFTARKKDALTLYTQLEALVQKYKKNYGYTPFIRVITHSHGGNVVLNMATLMKPHSSWLINEAIFLACPVQYKTKNLINCPLFNKIYSLYSTMDIFQIGDAQGLDKNSETPKGKGIFSERRFPDHKKLTQVKISINHHGLWHIGFITCSFFKRLPIMIDTLARWEEEQPHTPQEIRQLTLLY